MRKYNTQLPSIKLGEYGRNVQGLIDHCKTIPDRELRTRYAYTIIQVMADVFPEHSSVENRDNILWNHLARIANFELDIDYPVEIIQPQNIASKPTPIKAPQSNIKYRMYGKVIDQMLQKATMLPTPQERIRLFELCANMLKRNFHLVNKEADEDDDKIISDMIDYCGAQFQDEICQVYLYTAKELMENSQYDPAKLVEAKKKKKKKKKS